MDYTIGEITLFAFNFAPMGWMQCAGQLLNITTNQPLYSLILNTYGGSQAQNTFALPNLQGASPLPNMQYYICVQGLYPQRS